MNHARITILSELLILLLCFVVAKSGDGQGPSAGCAALVIIGALVVLAVILLLVFAVSEAVR